MGDSIYEISTDREWLPGCQGLGEGMGLVLMGMGLPFRGMRMF